jgi:hypothetical protein
MAQRGGCTFIVSCPTHGTMTPKGMNTAYKELSVLPPRNKRIGRSGCPVCNALKKQGNL